MNVNFSRYLQDVQLSFVAVSLGALKTMSIIKTKNIDLFTVDYAI